MNKNRSKIESMYNFSEKFQCVQLCEEKRSKQTFQIRQIYENSIKSKNQNHQTSSTFSNTLKIAGKHQKETQIPKLSNSRN